MKADAGDVVLTLTHDEAVRLSEVLFGAAQSCAWYPAKVQPDLHALLDALSVALTGRPTPLPKT
jgi:hypothetical protein